MSQDQYLISQAAKLVDVESHVLRYWEEEMQLPISRNPQGHRYYTGQDIQIFLAIKELKNKGFSLKKITAIIPQLYGKYQDLPHEETPEIVNPVETPATIDPSDKPIVPEPDAEPFPATVPLTAPTHEDKVSKKIRFEEIVERLIAEIQIEQGKGEGRYKHLDRQIRTRQVTRKMIAATSEDKKKKKRIFRLK